MANIIRIKRSTTSGNPSTLGVGELAYSSLSNSGFTGGTATGGGMLYIGTGSETTGNASVHTVIGGVYYTAAIDAATNANTASTLVKRDASGNFTAGTITAALSGTASTATAFATARTISITGDLSYTTPLFDGTGNVTATGTLATVNSNVGSFGSGTAIPVITVNAKGLITGVTTTTISTSIDLGAGTGSGTVSGGGTLTITGGQGITTSASGSTITVSANPGYTTTATAAGVTTLTATSTEAQFFTGTAVQTIQLPVVSTLVQGSQFYIYNNSTATLTVQSSGGNTVASIPAGVSLSLTCILTTGTTATSWAYLYEGASSSTGTGSLVFSTSPSLSSPSFSTITNTGTITIPTTTGTLALQGDTTYVGTTAVALNRTSANLALTGITAVTLPGSTSGSVQIIPTAVAGTGTVLTLPATTGTVITSGDTATVTNTMLAGSIANAKLTNSTISGVSLGNNLNALTIGTGLSGTTYNGSTGVTIAIDSTVATLTGSQILTNKTLTLPTIGGAGATFNGSSSGTITLLATATAGTSSLTLPAATDTLVGKATTDTFTNKTFDTAGTGNTFKVNGNTISAYTGSGSTVVLSTSPSLTTPSLGVATATSINALSFTAASAGFTIAGGTTSKTLTVSNTLTFTGTDSSSVAFGTGGTVAYQGGTLGQFAATTSSALAGVISDETGSGSLVFATSPTLVTPVLGAATATSITGPTSSTFTIAAGAGNNNISLTPTGTGTVDVAGFRISGLGTPTQATDAATKGYVDTAVTGLTWKTGVNLLATANIPLTGSTSTVTIDGHVTLTSTNTGYRLLLTGQTTAADKGIYLYTDNGTTYTLSRTSDADVYSELIGASVFVEEGTSYGKTAWVQSNTYITNFSGQNWVQFSGSGTYSAGNGLTLTGNSFDVVGTSGRISVAADSIDIDATYVGQTSITTLGTIASGTWQGGVVAGQYGGTGVANTGKTITLGGNLTTSGAFTTTLTATATTSVTLPSTGTLATLAGTETLTNKTLSSPTINTATIAGGTAAGLTGLAIRDTSAAFDVTLAATSSTTLTAGRTLTLDMVNAARTVKLGGNLTFAADLITSGANSLTLTTTAVTNVTLPTTGTLATLAGTEALSNKTITASSFAGSVSASTLSASGNVTFTSSTDATALGSAPVVLSGGLSVAKAMYIGTNITGAGPGTLAAPVSVIDGFQLDGGTY